MKYKASSIQLPEPFSMSEMIGYLTRSANECLFYVEADNVYRMIRVENEPVLVEITCRNDELEVWILDGIPPTKSVRVTVDGYVRDWFDLDRDLRPFYRQMEHCPYVSGLVRDHTGLRIVGVPDLFEALCWAIVGQQINLAFAYTLKRRFVETFGECLRLNGKEFWLFPSPETIANLSVAELRSIQFTSRKSEYVLEVAKRMTEGTLSKTSLMQSGDFKAAERDLVKIRGIGPWTANYVLMRCLRDPSAFPIEDVGLHNAVKERLGINRKPTLDELRAIASKWTGWEAYATFYLWRSLYHTFRCRD